MPNLDELKVELEDAETLKMISQAFTEASAAKLAKIRAKFENNRQFYEEINYLYHLVVESAKLAKVKSKVLTKSDDNGKVLLVAITSNQRFYGNININIMERFTEDGMKMRADLMVIGGTGRDYLKSVAFSKPYKDMLFAKDYPTEDEARVFLEYIKPYNTVNLYYPQFKSLVRQEVGLIDITQTSDAAGKISDDEINILFEPELSKIHEFFTTQIRSLLFFRVMLESDLARTAARLVTMSAAEDRSTETINAKKIQVRKIMLTISNTKLLETFSSLLGN
jgi:ATP synthase F1 gamma subunit